jgi:predicted MFS family arabinose efflux permease
VVTGGDGTYTVRWDDQQLTFSDFVIESGLIADMSRRCTTSTTVAASEATASASPAPIHSLLLMATSSRRHRRE